MKNYYVYILANKPNGTLYIGFTHNILQRIQQHKNNLIEGFTSKHHIHNLVYYEVFDDPENGIKREKRLKKYRRNAKINLIEKTNPEWIDLYNTLF